MNYLTKLITNGKQHERRQEMKSVKLVTTFAIAAVVMAAFVAPPAARAAGTSAGVSVTNTVDVNYTVNAQAQPAVQSSTSFLVDQRVFMTVQPNAATATSVLPAQNGAIFAFTVANTGNATIDLELTPGNTISGTVWNAYTDTFDMLVLTACIDADSDNACTATDDTWVDELAEDATAVVLFQANAPLTQADLDASVIELTITARAGGSAGVMGAVLVNDTGAWNSGAVQVVLADAGQDGQEAANGAYVMTSANLAVVKGADVLSDGFNVTPNAKAIPGATVRYTITVDNTGNSAADNAVVTDIVPVNTTFVAGSINAGAGNSYNGTTNVVTMPLTTPLAPAASDTVGYSVTID